MVVTTKREIETLTTQRPDVQDEAYGATQIGPFDYVPKVGFREYWYPCVWSKEVGRKPKNIKMLGEELVLFPGQEGQRRRPQRMVSPPRRSTLARFL